jgi:hypothetical protein
VTVNRRELPQLATAGQWLGTFDDRSSDENAAQAAALALNRSLPGRHRLSFGGKFQALNLSMGGAKNSIFPLAAYSRDGLAAAAAIRQFGGGYQAGVMVQRPGQSLAGAIGPQLVPLKRWMRWRLELSRLNTRQSIAVVFVNGNEAARFHFDSLARPVETFLFGIARSSPGVTGQLLGDDFELGDDYGRLGRDE